MDESVQFRRLKPVFLICAHDQSPRVINIFLIYNSVTIFNCLNSHEYFLLMSVTETSLPELTILLIFSVKIEMEI